MLSATSWVPRGFASEFPEKYELDDEEMERITKLAQLEIDDAKENIKSLEGEKDEDEEPEKVVKEQLEIDDDLKEYDLEHYDDDVEEGEGVLASIPGLTNEVEFHDGDDENDPYISLPTEEEALEDKQEYQIYPTDNLILSTRTEDDVSYLDVYIYDDGAGAPEGAEEEEADKLDPDVAKGYQRESSLYIHHDLMLPAFPLCVEWINYRPNKAGLEESDNVGNFAAIGTFDPQIEIWNLDCVDKAFPDAILGEPSSNSAAALKSKKNKKKSKSKHVTTHHTDAVLSLSHNPFHRNVLASTSADHTVKLWDLNTATAVRSIDSIHSNKHVSSSQWHPTEGTILLTGGYDGRVAISDVRVEDSSKLSKYWKIDGGQEIESVSWNTGEQFLAGTDQGNIYAFDVRNQENPLWTLKAHDAGISSLQVNKFMPDLLVTGAMGEKLIKLWKIPTESSTQKGPSMVFSRDFGVGNVLTSSFAPNIEIAGNLVVGGVNKGLKLFDVFSNRGVRNTFKDSLRDLQKKAREEAQAQGRASRIARKYQTDSNGTVLQVESDGEEISGDEGDDDDMDE